MKNKLFLTVILFFLLVNLIGCWNSIELDRRSIVVAVGIDKVEGTDEVMMTVQILKSANLGAAVTKGGDNGKDKSVLIISSKGETIFEAIRSLSLEVERKLYFQQNRLIVFSEEVAREGLYPVIDMFVRDAEMRTRVLLFVCQGKASEVLQGETNLETIPAVGIEELLENKKANSKAVEVTMHDFVVNLLDKTTSPIASKIELIKKSDKEESTGLKITGASAFKKDKLIGWLDSIETRGMLWITNEIQSGIIVVESPVNKNKDISFEIINASSEIEPKIINDNLIIDVEIEEEGTLGEQEARTKFNNQSMIEELERLKAKAIEEEIRACLKKVQKELKSDIFGFGEAVHRKYPDEWKTLESDWDTLFPKIDINIKVRAKIMRTGILTEPIGS